MWGCVRALPAFTEVPYAGATINQIQAHAITTMIIFDDEQNIEQGV